MAKPSSKNVDQFKYKTWTKRASIFKKGFFMNINEVQLQSWRLFLSNEQYNVPLWRFFLRPSGERISNDLDEKRVVSICNASYVDENDTKPADTSGIQCCK